MSKLTKDQIRANRIPVLERAMTTRYDLDAKATGTKELVALVRDLLAWDKVDRPAKGGDVFDRLEALSTLHRPTQGRYYLRHWVEDTNAAERGGPRPTISRRDIPTTRVMAAPDAPTEQLEIGRAHV